MTTAGTPTGIGRPCAMRWTAVVRSRVAQRRVRLSGQTTTAILLVVRKGVARYGSTAPPSPWVVPRGALPQPSRGGDHTPQVVRSTPRWTTRQRSGLSFTLSARDFCTSRATWRPWMTTKWP